MKKAIVIGSSSGIGKELAILLSQNGYKVGITGRRKKKLDEIQKINTDAFIVQPFDCTKNNSIDELNELVQELGGLDLLIFSSGIGDINTNLDYEIENRTNQLNVIAFTKITSWAYNYFEKQKQGHLVAISSIAGLRGGQFAPAYNASKAFQINYLEGLRQKSFKTKNPITITDIRPGFIDTVMAKGEGLFWVASKEKAAKQILKSIDANKDITYVSKRWRIIAILLKVLPNFIYKRL
jgi:short-subunit dehydrogenase